jgi:hypothetical protein
VARLHRITRNNPPTVDDFKSRAELGHPKPPGLPQRRWDGVSMWDDVERIRRMALRTPRLGAFIAELNVPDRAQREQEGPSGHFEV